MRPPATSRAARRAAAPKGPPRDHAQLAAALAAARLPGTPPEAAEQARRALLLWLDAARAAPFPAVVDALATGRAALAIAEAGLERTPPPAGLACAAGCAFCCILPGADGGTVTEAEARRLHGALAGLPGPHGPDWHAEACPALDPATRRCRAYGDRPLLCRAYVSTSAEACAEIAEGRPAPGPGVLAPHTLLLAAHGLARAALRGLRTVPTFALRRVAAAAVAGEGAEAALAAARHPPAALDAERRRGARGWARASRGGPGA
jgi:hypothetical protein